VARQRAPAHTLASAVDDRYSELEKDLGAEGAAAIAASHAAAIDYIEKLVRERGIDCAFQRVDGCLFAPPGQPTDLDAELVAATRAGLRCELIPRAPAISTGPAIRFFDQAQFHPLRDLRGLVDLARELGVSIHTGVHAEAIELASQHERPLTVKLRGRDPIAATYVQNLTRIETPLAGMEPIGASFEPRSVMRANQRTGEYR